MSNKPNPESVAKVLAAGIVPGCIVRDHFGDVAVVPPIDKWYTTVFGDSVHAEVGNVAVQLYAPHGVWMATVIKPAPVLPDTFDAQAHGHLITERPPADDEQGENDYLYGRSAYEEHVTGQTIATLRGTFRHDLRSPDAIKHLQEIKQAINELMGVADGPSQSHQQAQ